MHKTVSSWVASMPTNIALIKYMGKHPGNMPTNASLSYTSPDFYSTVTLACIEGGQDQFGSCGAISHAGQARFLAHLRHVKEYFGYSGAFHVRSRNNFPMGCGLASSASSFSALTSAACKAISDLLGVDFPTAKARATLSRLGSGSSCRSFFSPWCIWEDNHVRVADLPFSVDTHWIAVVSQKHKVIGSSEAHQRVRSSPLFSGRAERAYMRLQALYHASWRDAFTLVWEEFEDMHRLFATSDPMFGYITPETRIVLDVVRASWDTLGDGPLVTIDAGPNVHLLFRAQQEKSMQHIESALQGACGLIKSGEG